MHRALQGPNVSCPAKHKSFVLINAKANERKVNVEFSLQGVPIAKRGIDRSTEMRNLKQALLPDFENIQRKIFVLSGPGGIGKTKLAIEFMRQCYTRFSEVLRLDGISKDSLKTSIAGYASKIPLDQMSDTSRIYASTGEGDINTIVQDVLTWLTDSANNRWLLTIDNVDRDSNPQFSPSELDPLAYDIMQFLPSANHGSIIITTRLAELEQLGESQAAEKADNNIACKILMS